MKTEDAKFKLEQINKKNETTKEYSLGDVLLLMKYERELKIAGYKQKEIEALSPSYYLN